MSDEKDDTEKGELLPPEKPTLPVLPTPPARNAVAAYARAKGHKILYNAFDEALQAEGNAIASAARRDEAKERLVRAQTRLTQLDTIVDEERSKVRSALKAAQLREIELDRKLEEARTGRSRDPLDDDLK